MKKASNDMSNALEVQNRTKYSKFGHNKFFSNDDTTNTRSVSQAIGLASNKSIMRPGL